jgi:hypothetical protein
MLLFNHWHRSDRTETAHDVCQDHRQPGAGGWHAGIQRSRIPVATVVGMVADGMSTPEISMPIQTSMGLLL